MPTSPLPALPFVRGVSGEPGPYRCLDRTLPDLSLDDDRTIAAVAWLLRRYAAPARFALPVFVQGTLATLDLAPDAAGSISTFAQQVRDAQREPIERAPFILARTEPGDALDPRCEALIAVVPQRAGTTLTVRWGGTIEDDAAPRILDHLERLLRAASALPDAPLDELPLLGDDEARLLLETWNRTAAPYRDEPVTALFAEQVARRPQAEALVVGDRRYTYAELSSRASRLARWLIARGVGPGVLVGLAFERDVDLIVALLAVLMSGGAYVPLDPRNPPARQALILEDADVAVLLTQRGLADLFVSHADRVVLTAELELDGFDDTPFPTPAAQTDLAYVIYTSGSTGRPKGVMIDHRALSAFVAWTREGFSDEELSGALCASSIAFDVSVFELFGPLAHGGRTILVENVLALASAPARDEVRTISAVASGLAELVRQGPLPAGVMTVMQAGERLHAALARTLLEHPGIRLLNLCGGTEDTVYSVWHHVTSAEGNPPIGRPFSNHTVYVVDEQLRPVPIGVPGEIAYGGLGVARGYLNRPELTAEKFVPNPFGDSPRLYRSGDLVRWNGRGELEFLTRLDHQVKVRGFRVEAAEIERAILDHPVIAETIVVPFEVDGDTTLVAYVVRRDARAGSAAHLRAFLGERLPSYMVPTLFVGLAELPKNATGKVDRAALPAPSVGRGDVGTAYVAPRTDAERTVAALWAEILRVAEVGVDDDFFALGGHSLHAARIVARLRDRAPTLSLGAFFAAPTVAAVATHLVAQSEPSPEGTRGPRSAAYGPEDVPLSHAQEMMWFLDRVLPDGAVYNVPVAWRLEGDLDVGSLERALARLVERHDQLRTVFPTVEGRPVARTSPSGDLPLARARAGSAAACDEAVATEIRRAFDLGHGPLARALLIETDGAPGATLVLTFHHVVCDGWSLNLVFDDLLAFYAAERTGRPAELPALAVRYADHARGERTAQSDALYEADLAWWHERLHDHPRTDLVGDRQPPAVRTPRGGRTRRVLDGPAYEALRTFARERRTTVFQALLAAFAGFVARHTGERDIVLGVPIADRRYPELDPLVGNFIQMITLRFDVDPDRTFGELAADARETLLDAVAHAAPPFQLVVDRVAPVRSQTQTPLFSVAIVAQQPLSTTRAAGTLFTRVPAYTQTSKFDLLLELTDDGTGVELVFEYALDRFGDATAASLLETFEHLVRAAVAAPMTATGAIPLVAGEGRERLAPPPAVDPAASIAAAVPVNERFRAWAARTPEATALVAGAERWTYARLLCEADAVRARLAAHGVQPGDRVGLCAQRSPQLIAAILAILDAGAAYVPLDPQYPAQRLAYIAGDAALRVVLADRSSVDLLAGLASPAILIDDETRAVDAGPPAPAAAAAPAYVIYTSGSTGNPKGVVVEHRQLARLFTIADSRFAFGPADVWTLFHSYAFDFSVWEIWGALAYGATLVVVPAEVARMPRDFRRLCAEHGVTVLNQTPSAFYEFDAADAVETAPLALRYVVFGGEALDLRRLEGWFERHGDRTPRLVNMYGITETTVHVTFREIDAAETDAALPPIGVPLDDLGMMLLDAYGNVVPPGFPGEIYVTGAGVAAGYLDRPELTAARFVDDPAHLGHGRAYRSGDLGRRRVDGDYEYIGRADDQVKVRGFRIELGEIEAALARHAAVERAVVLVDRARGEVRLAAYVVLRPGADTLPDLRTHLAATLPHYMIPAVFVRIDAVPRTENGKLDRRALAAIDLPKPVSGGASSDEAGSMLERQLGQLFAEALGVPHIGLDDNFFNLGGHSLLAARLAARIEDEFAPAVARLRDANGRGGVLRVFYREPTIRALAETLEGGRVESSSVVRMRDGDPSKTPVFWFHGMFNGDGLYTWELMDELPADVPFYVIHPHGYDNRPFPADIERLADDHLAIIRSIRPGGPYAIGGFCNGALIAYEVAGRLREAGEEVESLVLVSMPPLIAAGQSVRALAERVGARLGLSEHARVQLFLYLRSYADRVDRFVRGSATHKWSIARRGVQKVVAKLGRVVRSAPAAPRNGVHDDFADETFKENYYTRAIAEYVPSPARGRATLVYGADIATEMVDPYGGWDRLIERSALHVIPGAHYCVVDNARMVGAIMRDNMNGHGDRVARRVS